MMRPLSLLACGLLPLAVAPLAAQAQTRHDTNAPIDVASNHIELQDKANRAILTGNVVITQAEMTLKADRVTVNYTGSALDGSPQASRLDAAGNVRVDRPDQNARSNFAVYDVDRRVITMVGNVTLRQAGNTVSGGRLSINLDTGRATIDGSGVQGSSAAGAPVQNQGGRVTGRFSVPKRTDSGSQPNQ